MSRNLAPDTLRALRNLAVAGCASPADLDKLDQEVRHKPLLQRLCAMHYIAETDQERNQPTRYELTGKGRNLLAAMFVRSPVRGKRGERDEEPKATGYSGHDLQRMGATRPNALDASRLPSRYGNRLEWPDGRTTDLQGNPFSRNQ